MNQRADRRRVRLHIRASLIHSNISFTLLLRIERPCRLHGWGEQSSTKSKTGLSEKQFRRLKARQRLLCGCVRSLTPRRRGAGCRRFEHRSSSVHLRMLQTWLYPPAFTLTLHETSARWGCNIADIAGWADAGKFRILTGITAIRCGEEIVGGKVVLSPMELLPLFRRCGTGPTEGIMRRIQMLNRPEWMFITDPVVRHSGGGG